MTTAATQFRVLGLIPARGGSKGVPRKNIRPLHGKPLLAYTAAAALAARSLSRVLLSTEDEEIAAAGRALGLDVPFLRPAELAQDTTAMLPVMQHALQFAEAQDGRYDAICLLQPTNPLRRAEDIDGCVEKLLQSDATSVVTMLPVPAEYNPHWVYFQDAEGVFRLSTGEATPITRRQALPPAYHREGSVYVTRRDTLLLDGSLFGPKLLGYPMEPERSVNIDTLEDWHRAEALLAQPEN